MGGGGGKRGKEEGKGEREEGWKRGGWRRGGRGRRGKAVGGEGGGEKKERGGRRGKEEVERKRRRGKQGEWRGEEEKRTDLEQHSTAYVYLPTQFWFQYVASLVLKYREQDG